MKLSIDPDIDAAYLRLTDKPVAESEEVAPGIVLDFDAEGNVIGIEILALSLDDKRLTSVEIEPKAA
ncbi:MAG: DUF2283 domain-containing protein [Bacteroidetes bacterium]|nr:DUF2283 domain-containing protein [Bacteroidota bacterium]MCH8030887.1 DUF2283 domain-containing protein [Bacteroidota bacterium]